MTNPFFLGGPKMPCKGQSNPGFGTTEQQQARTKNVVEYYFVPFKARKCSFFSLWDETVPSVLNCFKNCVY